MNRTTITLAAALATLALAGCSGGALPAASDNPTTALEPANTLVTTQRPVTVLDDGDGAELCLGGVLESYPPQCGGPKLTNWNWADHDGTYEEVSGVRWGEYIVEGTYDHEANSFAVTDATDGADFTWAIEPQPLFATPCEAPAGGWAVLDPITTTQASLDATIAAAYTLPNFANVWLDQSVNPAYSDSELTEGMNDPTLLILNVSVAGDTDAAEATLRETWGGMLCVSEPEAAVAGSADLLDALTERLGDGGQLLSSYVDISGVVQLSVTYDDGTLQQALDAEYGAGRIVVTSALVRSEG